MTCTHRHLPFIAAMAILALVTHVAGAQALSVEIIHMPAGYVAKTLNRHGLTGGTQTVGATTRAATWQGGQETATLFGLAYNRSWSAVVDNLANVAFLGETANGTPEAMLQDSRGVKTFAHSMPDVPKDTLFLSEMSDTGIIAGTAGNEGDPRTLVIRPKRYELYDEEYSNVNSTSPTLNSRGDLGENLYDKNTGQFDFVWFDESQVNWLKWSNQEAVQEYVASRSSRPQILSAPNSRTDMWIADFTGDQILVIRRTGNDYRTLVYDFKTERVKLALRPGFIGTSISERGEIIGEQDSRLLVYRDGNYIPVQLPAGVSINHTGQLTAVYDKNEKFLYNAFLAHEGDFRRSITVLVRLKG